MAQLIEFTLRHGPTIQTEMSLVCMNYRDFNTIHMVRTLSHNNRMLPYRHACVSVVLALSC